MRKLLSLVLLALVAVPSLAGGMAGQQHFIGGGCDLSIEVDTPGDFFIEIPGRTSALKAVMDVTLLPQDGIAPVHPSLSICGTTIWAFEGTGYGSFGRQTLFSDGSASKTFSFGEGGGTAGASIRLPRGASVTGATMDIECEGGSQGWTDTPLRGPGPGEKSIGGPPADAERDWVALVRKR